MEHHRHDNRNIIKCWLVVKPQQLDGSGDKAIRVWIRRNGFSVHLRWIFHDRVRSTLSHWMGVFFVQLVKYYSDWWSYGNNSSKSWLLINWIMLSASCDEVFCQVSSCWSLWRSKKETSEKGQRTEAWHTCGEKGFATRRNRLFSLRYSNST